VTNAFAVEQTLEEAAQQALFIAPASAWRVQFTYKGKHYSVTADEEPEVEEMQMFEVEVTRTVRITQTMRVPGIDSGDAEEIAMELARGQRSSQLDLRPQPVSIEGFNDGEGEFEAFAKEIPPTPVKEEKAA
jgi:hypothetical protein